MSDINLFGCDENMISIILEIYQRSEKSLNEDVLMLKNWMKTQPHLPEIFDEKSLQNFLILNKFSMERAKRSIDMYYTIRTHVPEIYHNSRDLKFMENMDAAYWVPLPKLTKEMYRVSWAKVHNKNKTEVLDPYNYLLLMSCVQEIKLREDIMFGDVYVFDLEDLPVSYFLKITPTLLSKLFLFYEKIYSIPVKGVYCLNSPPIVNSILNIIKTLVKPKIFKRIHIYKDASIIHEIFPKERIPKDYGGEEKSLKELNDVLKLKIQQYQDHFDHLDTLKVDESLRPEKLENDDILGFHGNFKKLDVD